MRNVLVVVALFLLASAAEAASSIWLATKSGYVGGIAGTVFHEGPVVQGSVTVPIGGDKSPFYGGTWFSASLEERDENLGDEIDFYAGWCSSVGGGKKLDVGLNYYDMMPVRSCKGDFLSAYANYSGCSKLGAWNIHVEYDMSTERSSCPSGLLLQTEFWPKSLQRGKTTIGLVIAGHPEAFGVPAEPISFVALDAKVPMKDGFYMSVWAQKATGIEGGMAEDAVVFGLNWSP